MCKNSTRFPSTIVWRHRKENLKKCSLRFLEERNDFQFFTYPGSLPDLNQYIVLDLDASPLSKEDASYGLFIIDATWRYAKTMLNALPQKEKMIYRSLPANYRTAYPRRQADCPFPDRGLASLEAIYIAYTILDRETDGLLDHYYWKDDFIKKNLDSLGSKT